MKSVVMERIFKYDEKQQSIIKEFYDDAFTYSLNEWGYKFLAYMFQGIATVMLCMPYQELISDGEEIRFYMVWLGFFGSMFYALAFKSVLEGQKRTNFTTKLKYIPVSQWQLYIFRLKRLIKFTGKWTIFYLFGQLTFTQICFGTIFIENILYPIIVGFVIPVVINVLGCMIEYLESILNI